MLIGQGIYDVINAIKGQITCPTLRASLDLAMTTTLSLGTEFLR